VHAFEVPVIVNTQEYLVHVVKGGESYEVLARTYNTTTEVLLAINYNAPSPLWAKSAIIIAPGLTAVDPNAPALQAYEVVDNFTTISSLAATLSVDEQQLRLYNECVQACNLAAGDWVIIPHTK
jgi:hypothetical protein